MSLFDAFYRILAVENATAKVAGDVAEVRDEKQRLWQDCLARTGGEPTKLARLALKIAEDAEASGMKLAADAGERADWAASFACAGVVDRAIDAGVKTGGYSPAEGAALKAVNAEAAFFDLCGLTKTALAGGLIQRLVAALASRSGATLGGAAIGGGIGALNDREQPLRGMVGGALMGGSLGHMAHAGFGQMQGMQQEQLARAANQAKLDAAKQEQAVAAMQTAQALAREAVAKAEAAAAQAAAAKVQAVLSPLDMLRRMGG